MRAYGPFQLDEDLVARLRSLSEGAVAESGISAEELEFMGRVESLVGEQSAPGVPHAERAAALLSAWHRGSRLATVALGRAYSAQDEGNLAEALAIIASARDAVAMPFFTALLSNEYRSVQSDEFGRRRRGDE